jgi:hypothetical protein
MINLGPDGSLGGLDQFLQPPITRIRQGTTPAGEHGDPELDCPTFHVLSFLDPLVAGAA